MKVARISKSGQISIPVHIRRRWQTDMVLMDEREDAIVLMPLPDDPIGAALGSLGVVGSTSEDARQTLREEEMLADRRRRIDWLERLDGHSRSRPPDSCA